DAHSAQPAPRDSHTRSPTRRSSDLRVQAGAPTAVSGLVRVFRTKSKTAVWKGRSNPCAAMSSGSSCSTRSAWAEGGTTYGPMMRSEEHTSELQSRENLVCRLLLEKK